jgi:hypothetical protein
MNRAALLAILGLDVARLALLLPQLPRADRPHLRNLTLRAYQELEAVTQDDVALLALTLEVQGALMPFDSGQPPQTVWTMRTSHIWPESLRRTIVADRVVAWQTRFDRRWQVRMALSAARLAWLESRVAERAPTQVATVRAPEEKQNRESLELLHKRGRTRFS